jgi:hypothetical protein
MLTITLAKATEQVGGVGSEELELEEDLRADHDSATVDCLVLVDIEVDGHPITGEIDANLSVKVEIESREVFPLVNIGGNVGNEVQDVSAELIFDVQGEIPLRSSGLDLVSTICQRDLNRWMDNWVDGRKT